MISYAEEVAREHVAYRRGEGWSRHKIAHEADMCCRLCGIRSPKLDSPYVAALKPYEDAPYWAIERAFALAYEASQTRRLAA